MAELRERVYRQGKHARLWGKMETDNPFPYQSRDWFDWWYGWCDAGWFSQ